MRLAVKLPEELAERVSCFPFLQALVKSLKARMEKENEGKPEEEADRLEVHLISEKSGIEVLYLLPFQAYYHEMEREDLKNVFTAHRAVKNWKLEEADVFVSLTESFVDASIGKSLKAKTRAGFALGKNAFFLNRKASLLKGRHFVEQRHEILKLLVDDAPEAPAKGFSRELTPFFKDWSENPYYLVNLSASQNTKEIEDYWEELFSLVQDERFVLMCDSLPLELQKASLQEFIKNTGGANRYEVFESSNLIDFSKLAAFAQTFITVDSPLLQLAAYAGAHIHYLGKKGDYQRRAPVYFLGEVRYFNLNEPLYKEGSDHAYHKVFDDIIKFIDLKSKERQKERKN